MAALVGVHVSGTPAHAAPIVPAAHNGTTVWTGTDSSDFDVWDIRGLLGSLGAATLTTSEGIVVTAVQPGASGQDITVAIVAAGAPNSPLSITVVGNEITVSLATGPAGTPTSTAAQVASALNASPAASALVSTSPGGSGSALVGAMSQTALTPVVTGHANLTMFYEASFGPATLTTSEGVIVTAVQPGHDITVAIVDPGVPNSPLMITVIGDEIVVTLATGPSGTPTSTAAQVVAALNASPAASALVIASTGGSGSALVGAMSQTALTSVVVEAGAYAPFYETAFSNSPSHPQNALIAYLGGGPSIPAGATYLYVKDGKQRPAFYVYDLLAPAYAWNGSDDLTLENFWAPTGSITSVKIFGTPAAVPEVSSVSLLAIGLATRAWKRRRGASKD